MSPTLFPYGVCTRITGNGPSAGVVVPLTAGAWIEARRTRPSRMVTGMSLVVTTSYVASPGCQGVSALAGAQGTTTDPTKSATAAVTRRIDSPSDVPP